MEKFKETIKNYLDNRAKRDSLFAKVYKDREKNLDECCNYILQEVRKMGASVALCDEEVYCLAVHYYDEQHLSVKAQSNVTIIHTTPTEDDKPMFF